MVDFRDEPWVGETLREVTPHRSEHVDHIVVARAERFAHRCLGRADGKTTAELAGTLFIGPQSQRGGAQEKPGGQVTA
jgi:hypothetical protein